MKQRTKKMFKKINPKKRDVLIQQLKKMTIKNKRSVRPDRDTIINNEDILNLKIALNSSKSFDDFLRMV